VFCFEPLGHPGRERKRTSSGHQHR
jgi:hypothetical protein